MLCGMPHMKMIICSLIRWISVCVCVGGNLLNSVYHFVMGQFNCHVSELCEDTVLLSTCTVSDLDHGTTMAHYKGAAKEAGRALNLIKKRQKEQEELEAKKRKIEDELKIGNITNKFAAHYDAIEQRLKSDTVGKNYIRKKPRIFVLEKILKLNTTIVR